MYNKKATDKQQQKKNIDICNNNNNGVTENSETVFLYTSLDVLSYVRSFVCTTISDPAITITVIVVN